MAATSEAVAPAENPASTRKGHGSAGLDFNPQVLHRRFGADFGEKYHTDPLYRHEVDARTARRLHEAYGSFGLGNPDPQPGMSVAIQPLDFLNAALGGRILYKEGDDCWTPDRPLAHLDSLAAVAAMPDIDWDANAFLQQYWRQVDTLQKHYPDRQVAHVQGVSDGGCDVMHTPYTTAFRLLGDTILEHMMIEDDLANAIMDYIMRQYFHLWETIRRRMGWKRGTAIHLGDCAATMLSPALYENLSLPRYRKLLDERYSECSLHSCGPSTHLLKLFARVPGVKWMQLGDGTDLSGVRELFPDTFVCAYFNAGNMLALSPEAIREKALSMAAALRHDFVVSASSVDPATPEPHIRAFLETAERINADYGN